MPTCIDSLYVYIRTGFFSSRGWASCDNNNSWAISIGLCVAYSTMEPSLLGNFHVSLESFAAQSWKFEKEHCYEKTISCLGYNERCNCAAVLSRWARCDTIESLQINGHWLTEKLHKCQPDRSNGGKAQFANVLKAFWEEKRAALKDSRWVHVKWNICRNVYGRGHI